ncbi:MAG: hypothetical protein ACP5G4_03145 [bacterium]
MKKLIFLSMLLIAFSGIADIKVAVLKVRPPDYILGLMEAIDAVFVHDTTVDLILGPAEVLGGDTNRARIIFEDSAGVILPRSDGFSRSWCVKSTIEGAQYLAERYGTTIIPGTLWEIDENMRCYESIPIIGPDGLIQRVRRKAHNASTDYAIDSGIRLDTIYTRDGSDYTYLIAINNETRDLWDVYPHLDYYNPDILLVSASHWSEDFYQAGNMTETGFRPDPAFMRSYVSDWNEDMLDHLASINTAIFMSSLFSLPGGLFAANFYNEYLPDSCWFGFDETNRIPYTAIYSLNPDAPVVNYQMHVAIRATDSLGAPVESVFVNFGPAGEVPSNAGWTDETGFLVCMLAVEESVFFLMAKDSFTIVPEETTLYVSSANPACTLDVRVEIDSTYGIDETLLPGDFAISARPNPFNSAVTIAIDGVVDGSPVPFDVEIYDVNGRRIAQLPVGEGLCALPFSDASPFGSTHRCSPTEKAIVWTPDETLPSGVYLVRARFDGCETACRIVYLK